MKRLGSLLLLLAFLSAACAGPSTDAPTRAPTVSPAPASSTHTLTVFAAASLTDAFGEIGRAFEASHPGIKVSFNFAGSQALRTQIEQGAPADVFASAGPSDMDTLVTEAHVNKSDVQSLLTNRLEVILPAKNPAALETLEDLASPGLKLVLAAPDVPVGKYSRQALDQMNAVYGNDFGSRVLANVVSKEDNVKQVIAKVQLGEADAGIVYVSDAVAAPDLKTIEIPPSLNIIAHYVIAPVAGSSNPGLAGEFVSYTLSPEAQPVLAKWGFGPRP